MQRGDVDEILAIERASFPAPWPRSAFDLALAAPELLSQVAEFERIVGYVVGCPDDNHLLIANIAVCPDARRQGLGRVMLEAAIDHAQRIHLEGCELDVRASNLGARRLYREFGFKVIGVRPGYYQHPDEDSVAMRLAFAGPRSAPDQVSTPQ
ncbi:MAG: ribosomal-protein-alanine N-acetyltransferase [Acidobacteria bacterium]|nr:ribosomal-protein-alanine N-acetyltransferase [Acidobacteriota bacterium]